MNTYKSIVPSEMTRKELIAMCGDIYTAKQWGLDYAIVKISSNDMEYKVDVKRHNEYQSEILLSTPSIEEIIQEMNLHNDDEVGINNQWSFIDAEHHLLLSDKYVHR